jgi:hypothetical protein
MSSSVASFSSKPAGVAGAGVDAGTGAGAATGALTAAGSSRRHACSNCSASILSNPSRNPTCPFGGGCMSALPAPAHRVRGQLDLGEVRIAQALQKSLRALGRHWRRERQPQIIRVAARDAHRRRGQLERRLQRIGHFAQPRPVCFAVGAFGLAKRDHHGARLAVAARQADRQCEDVGWQHIGGKIQPHQFGNQFVHGAFRWSTCLDDRRHSDTACPPGQRQ